MVSLSPDLRHVLEDEPVRSPAKNRSRSANTVDFVKRLPDTALALMDGTVMNWPKPGPSHFLGALILLTAFTWALGLLDIQYKSVSTLGFTDGFPGAISDWRADGDPGNIILAENSVQIERNTPNRSYAKRTYELPAAQELAGHQIRVRGEITTVKRATPIEKKNVAAFMIWFLDENRETFSYLTVQELTGDFNHYRSERIVSVPDNARYYSATLINRDSDGAFKLTNASVDLVTTSMAYQIISPIMMILWFICVLTTVIWIARHGSRTLSATMAALLVLTLLGIVIPDSVNTQFILPAYKNLASRFSMEGYTALVVFYKLGHFLFFFTVALCMFLNRQRLRISALMIFAYMAVFAIATEGLQLHLFSRSTRLSDMGIDLGGVLLAWLISTVIIAILNRKRRSRRR